ncbi:MAG: hypothetical protein JNM51_07320 [Bacteroidia bacterium]|nr:hypothetical protein [Bacteroidia bacterium]
MRRYIDHAILWDFILVVFIGTSLLLYKPLPKLIFNLPTFENVNNFGVSLITVSATLIGFLLTIITVIVTFKKGFEDKANNGSQKSDYSEIPEKTIFGKKISKEKKFYDSEIHKNVVDVFVDSTYEIGVILFVLLLLQFNIINSSIFCISVIVFCLFIALLLSITRSLYIFRLFLRVHIHEKTIDENKALATTSTPRQKQQQ